MSHYLDFVVAFGALLTLMGVIAAWLFRTAAAPLSAKIILPVLAVSLGWYAPFAVSKMMGFPVTASMAELPDRAELVAFVAHDEDKVVDLWLPDGDTPRAYETKLTPRMKKTLREAEEAMARGGRAALRKEERPRSQGFRGDPLGVGDDQRIYELDVSALSALPPKE